MFELFLFCHFPVFTSLRNFIVTFILGYGVKIAFS